MGVARDRALMREAIALAERGRGRVEPNPRVGCVLARDDEIVGRGWHADFGGPHAEVAALRDAGERARGATAFVTLEPCSTTGKTPPCTEALVAAGVARVVYAAVDPNPDHAGRADAVLEGHGIEVRRGLLAEEAEGLLDDFRLALGRDRPWVVLKWASTLDGRIATVTGDSKWITGEAARLEVHRERARCRGILVGIGTVLADDPELTTRGVPGPNPRRYVLDPGLRTPETARLLDVAAAPTTLFCAPDADASRKSALEERGVAVVAVGPSERGLDLEAVLREIQGRDRVGRLLVEGGARVLGSFVRERRFDQARVFLAPRLLAASDARPALEGPTLEHMREALDLELLESGTLGGDLRLELRPRRD